MAKIQLIPQYKGGYKDRAGKLYSYEEGQSLLRSGQASAVQWKGNRTGTLKEPQKGRKKGSKNLERVDGGYRVGAKGSEFIISQEEKRALENAVNKANRYRKKILEQEANMPFFFGGEYKGATVGEAVHRLGGESDFIVARKSKSLQQFKTREDYENYMKNLARISSPTYMDDRTRLYKRNHMKAIENVYGDDAKDVLMKIRMMKPEEYRTLVQSDDALNVSYVYDPSDLAGKLNKMRSALKMAQKEAL